MSFDETQKLPKMPMYGILAPHVAAPKVKSTRPHLKHKGMKNWIKARK